MPAIALFRGPAHVMEWANPEFLNSSPRDGRGMPIAESFPEPRYADLIMAMDECWESRAVIQRFPPGGIARALYRAMWTHV